MNQERIAYPVGSKVKVHIVDWDRYAMDAAKNLHGAKGIVREAKEIDSYDSRLVEFTTPVKKWWTYQSPVWAFWFPVHELLKDVSE